MKLNVWAPVNDWSANQWLSETNALITKPYLECESYILYSSIKNLTWLRSDLLPMDPLMMLREWMGRWTWGYLLIISTIAKLPTMEVFSHRYLYGSCFQSLAIEKYDFNS